eukprot:maker-scaffold_4-snap-gene-17.54-mRNA-1 protein AED:0.03 eAED:0.17 QI:0/0.75/0.8/1/0/0/5/1479/139
MAFYYVPVQDFHGFVHFYLGSAFWMVCFYVMLVFGRSYICFKLFEDNWRCYELGRLKGNIDGEVSCCFWGVFLIFRRFCFLQLKLSMVDCSLLLFQVNDVDILSGWKNFVYLLQQLNIVHWVHSSSSSCDILVAAFSEG